MIKNLFNKGLLFGIMALSYLPLQTFAQTSINYTADSTMSDAMVANGGLASSNFGTQAQMNVLHQTGQQIPVAFRTYIQYDLSAIPADALIIEAKLKLMAGSVDNSANHPVYIERVGSGAWVETTITWNNQPGVVTTDQLSFSHAATSSTGLQEFVVTDHVQKMVANPNSNNGWRMRLQSESGTVTNGMFYNSSEASISADRPVLTVEYILPVEMTTTVNHCAAGASDGTMSVMVSGGNTYGLSNMYFYKTNRDTTQVGKATLSNAKVINNLQFNSGTGEVTADNLEPGIYILRVFDSPYYTSNDLRFAYYKHILVGREGEVTSGILLPNYQYQENTTIEFDKPTNLNPLDRANTNYHNQTTSIPLRISDAPNNYEKASLVKYELDFDDQLEFTAAELKIKAWGSFFRHNNSSNAVNYTLITENWQESDVTWNTRPAIDTNYRVYVPTTTYIGYDPVHNIDTVDLLTMVEYWQDNPGSNHGFEMALETYGATQFASREYKSANTNANYVYFEWSVKMDVETAFNDTTNRGTLTVNAPNGTLPFKYLINTEPLGTLAQAWAEIGDTTYIDSLDFFTANVNAAEYTFTGLPSGKYYIGVYDNSGTKIMDGSGIVNTEILLASSSNLALSNSNILTKNGGQGNGMGRLYAEILDVESFGGMSFTVNSVDEFYIGFNKSAQSLASSATDFEFGLKVASNGAYQIIKDNVLLASAGNVSLGDEIDLIKDYGDYVVLINGTEQHRGPITTLDDEDISLDLVLVGVSAELELVNYWGNFTKPRINAKVNYPECGEFFGSVTVTHGGSATIIYSTLVNNDGVSPNPLGAVSGTTYVYGSVPLGTYTLTTAFSIPPMYGMPGYSYVIEEQIAVGYVVEWEELVDNYVLPLNTIQRGPGILSPGIATANSVNRTFEGYDNWIQFETVLYTPYALGGTSGLEVLAFRNQDGVEAMRLITGGLIIPTAKAIVNDDGDGYVDLLVDPNAVWRIERDEYNDYDIFHNGNLISGGGLSAVPGDFDISIYQSNAAKYVKTIASFCTFSKNDFVAKTKPAVDGGYYVAVEDNVKFQYTGEYNQSDLAYELTNADGDVISAVLYTVETIPSPGDENKKNADNRYEIDLLSLPSGSYQLKITNVKGEEHFIRIKL
jgi:hypothetical protein